MKRTSLKGSGGGTDGSRAGTAVRARRAMRRSGAWMAASAAAAATAAAAAMVAGTDAPDAPPPCPPVVEVPCEFMASGGQGPITPGVLDTCGCGPGEWSSTRTVQLMPRAPQEAIDVTASVNLTTWRWSRAARAEPNHAEASIDFAGTSHLWSSGSFTKRASASQSTSSREEWVGDGVPCARLVSLAAAGGAALELTITCAAAAGCSASGSTTVAGSCSSIGDANAHLGDKTVRGEVGYSAHERKLELLGRFGTSTDDGGVGIEGKISAETSWKLSGSGSASGSAAYTVLPDRTYCAFTNRAYVVRSNGNVSAVGGGTVSGNGTIALSASAFVNFNVM